jgi:hypothetical protein
MNLRCVALVGLMMAACRPMDGGGIAEARADEVAPAKSARGVAVVELFTSEGCSSCPPADAVVAELTAADPSVYALSFHVDYWDDLGWPDRFASSAFTDRQRGYARSLGSRGLYTPEMIVNGVEAFTGSDGARARQAVGRSLAAPAPVPLSIRVEPSAPHAITVDFDAPEAPAGSVIDIAVVERSVSTDVRAGENAGHLLHHVNVVRAYVTVPGKRTGSALVPMPASLRPESGEVIAYVQRASDAGGGMPVLGATRAPLPH